MRHSPVGLTGTLVFHQYSSRPVCCNALSLEQRETAHHQIKVMHCEMTPVYGIKFFSAVLSKEKQSVFPKLPKAKFQCMANYIF